MTGRRRDQTRDVTGGRPVVAVLATLVAVLAWRGDPRTDLAAVVVRGWMRHPLHAPAHGGN